MPTVPTQRVTDPVSTFGAATWVQPDKEDAVPVPEAELDQFVGEIWGNGVCQALKDINETYSGQRAIIGPWVVGAVTYSATDGSAGQVLTTDGAGNATFEDLPPSLSVSGTNDRLVRMDGTAGLQDSGITVEDTNDVSGVRVLTAEEVSATSAVVSPTVIATSSAHLSSYAELDEQSSVGNPGAGDGRLWVRSDTPNVPMYTDDAGDDHMLAYSSRAWEIPLTVSTVCMTNTWGTLCVSGRTDVAEVAAARVIHGSTQQQTLTFNLVSSIHNVAVWECVLPRAYAGGGITVDIWICSTANATAADPAMNGAFDRQAVGSNVLSANTFAAPVAFVVVGTHVGTNNILRQYRASFTSGSAMDSIQSGEIFRFALRRSIGAFTQDVRFLRGVIYESA